MRQLTNDELTTVFGAGIYLDNPLDPSDSEKTFIHGVAGVCAAAAAAITLEYLPVLSGVAGPGGALFGLVAGLALGDGLVRLNRYFDNTFAA